MATDPAGCPRPRAVAAAVLLHPEAINIWKERFCRLMSHLDVLGLNHESQYRWHWDFRPTRLPFSFLKHRVWQQNWATEKIRCDGWGSEPEKRGNWQRTLYGVQLSVGAGNQLWCSSDTYGNSVLSDVLKASLQRARIEQDKAVYSEFQQACNWWSIFDWIFSVVLSLLWWHSRPSEALILILHLTLFPFTQRFSCIANEKPFSR